MKEKECLYEENEKCPASARPFYDDRRVCRGCWHYYQVEGFSTSDCPHLGADWERVGKCEKLEKVENNI